MEYLEKNRLENSKNIFSYNLEQIFDFCYNKDDIENILKELDKTKNDDL